MADYTLGPLPWSEEELRTLYFQDFKATELAIQEHPGFEVFQDLTSLDLSLAIFRACVSDFLRAIDSFHKQAADPKFWTRPQRERFEQSGLTITKELFGAIGSAIVLVDCSRRIKKWRSIAGYDEKRSEIFDQAEHEFIQGLRNYATHFRIVETHWQREYTAAGKRTKFLIRRSSLLRWKKWTKPAHEFIGRHPNEIDVGNLMRSYSERVEAFQQWFRDRIRDKFREELLGYLHYERMLRRFGTESFWRIALTNLIERSVDPLSYLDRYLTDTEIAEVLALPKRLVEQVDRIIEILDEYGACDSKLRELTYKAFGVYKSENSE